MLKPQHHQYQQPLRIPEMQAFRYLFHHKKKLIGPTTFRSRHSPRSLSFNPGEQWGFPHGIISSDWRTASYFGTPSFDDEASAYQEGGDENRVNGFYDPLSGSIVTGAKGASGEDGPIIGEVDSASPEKPNSWEKESMQLKEVTLRKGFPRSTWANTGYSPVLKKKTGKAKETWVCGDCGFTTGQWWGTCRSCQAVNTLKRFTETDSSKPGRLESPAMGSRSWLPQGKTAELPQSLMDVNRGINQSDWRIPLSGLFGMEVARVLGGGIVPGSLILVGGDPGVGKSTLLLQVASTLSEGSGAKGAARVLYVSGEESIEQIGNRADRMNIASPDIFLYSSTDIEDIIEKVQMLSPQLLVVDSIQTVYLRGVPGSAGNIAQVKECTSALLRFAKQTNIPVLLIGHVTKTGDLAGPRMLEHIVDVVLYMEGERHTSYRLLRSVKNRFGSTDELGVFEMSQLGLQAVMNPSEIFLSDSHSDSEVLAGLAVAVILDGSRAFLLEVQALCINGLSTSRQVNGIKESKANMIISVLIKQAGLMLQNNAVHLNIVSGYNMTETAGDLAIAAAISSSFLEVPIPNDVAFIGEIGLGGELRMVPRMDRRISTLAKLGYKRCVIPKPAAKVLATLNFDIMLLPCKNLKEVISTIFSAD